MLGSRKVLEVEIFMDMTCCSAPWAAVAHVFCLFVLFLAYAECERKVACSQALQVLMGVLHTPVLLGE